MSLQDQLLQDMKQAMKDKDQQKLGVIRLLRSEVKNVEIDQGELDDQAVQEVISKLKKQLEDALEDFKQADRTELVEEQLAKIKVLESYLPEQMSDAELQEIVTETIENLDQKAMGPAMKQVMAKVKGQAEGKRVSQLVQQALQSQD
jgi:uncharacterized protein YqeY